MELKKLSWLHRYQYDLLPKEYKELKNEYNSLTTSLSKKIKRYDKIKNEIEVLRNDIRIESKNHNQLHKELEFINVTKKEISNNTAFKKIDLLFIKSANLNVGRHNLMKIAIDKNLNIEYIRAFFGHYPSGGEFLGKFSCLDNSKYREYMLFILEQLATTLNINKIHYAK